MSLKYFKLKLQIFTTNLQKIQKKIKIKSINFTKNKLHCNVYIVTNLNMYNLKSLMFVIKT